MVNGNRACVVIYKISCDNFELYLNNKHRNLLSDMNLDNFMSTENKSVSQTDANFKKVDNFHQFLFCIQYCFHEII